MVMVGVLPTAVSPRVARSERENTLLLQRMERIVRRTHTTAAAPAAVAQAEEEDGKSKKEKVGAEKPRVPCCGHLLVCF